MSDETGSSCECHLRDSSVLWRLWTDWSFWLVFHASQNLGTEDHGIGKRKVDIVCSGAILQADGTPGRGYSCSCATGDSPRMVIARLFLLFSEFLLPCSVDNWCSLCPTPCFPQLKHLKKRIRCLSSLEKWKLQYFLSYCFMGSLHFYNMGNVKLWKAERVKLSFSDETSFQPLSLSLTVKGDKVIKLVRKE